MSKRRIGGKDVDVMMGNFKVRFANFSASITDNRAETYTCGIPNGYVDGDVKCDGEIEVDTANFNVMSAAAKKVGSWRAMKPVDIVSNADTSDEAFKVELFGCLLNISDLLSAEAAGGKVLTHKIKFAVTSPDFVRINGVPYLELKDTQDLI